MGRGLIKVMIWIGAGILGLVIVLWLFQSVPVGDAEAREICQTTGGFWAPDPKKCKGGRCLNPMAVMTCHCPAGTYNAGADFGCDRIGTADPRR
jgi:hypothetical protein